MGCISSKVLSRSLSFQDELNQRLNRSSSTHFLALVSSTNSVAVEQEEKIHLQQQPANSPVLHKVTEIVEVDLTRRSKSFRWYDDCEVSSLISEGRTRSRSFHTVEEFDAMVEKLCISRTEESFLHQQRSESPAELSEHSDDNHDQELKVKHSGSKPENITIQDIHIKGLKRKAIANELGSLSIPPRIQTGEQVYSPGTYVTPKFGSYNASKSGLANRGSNESTIFDPELVAAFEECMEQLEVEEESILKQIEESFKEEDTQKV